MPKPFGCRPGRPGRFATQVTESVFVCMHLCACARIVSAFPPPRSATPGAERAQARTGNSGSRPAARRSRRRQRARARCRRRLPPCCGRRCGGRRPNGGDVYSARGSETRPGRRARAAVRSGRPRPSPPFPSSAPPWTRAVPAARPGGGGREGAAGGVPADGMSCAAGARRSSPPGSAAAVAEAASRFLRRGGGTGDVCRW